jgi:hypothetical protein
MPTGQQAALIVSKTTLSYALECSWSVALCKDANETISNPSSSFIIHLIHRRLPSQSMLIYLPIIISGREDATVKHWNGGTLSYQKHPLLWLKMFIVRGTPQGC